MKHPSNDPDRLVSWVERVNRTWIVHQNLDQTAASYINFLKKEDPKRLRQSCSLAYQLVHNGGASEDPKPRFYGGLFSLASEEEAERFLANHWFIAQIIPNKTSTAVPAQLAAQTGEQITRLRSEITQAVQKDRTA